MISCYRIISLVNFLTILAAIGRISGDDSQMICNETGYCKKKADCFGKIQNGNCPMQLVCCENRGISAEKCKEHGQYVYKKEFAEALTARALFHTTSECSIEATPLIVGGLKAKPKEFPHMAAIGCGDDIKKAEWICGGSLISENYILTAAHCSTSDEGSPIKFVRLGATDLSSNENYQDFEIAEIVLHPRYKPQSRYNDIALLKLTNPVEINEYVRPACLHSTFDEFEYKKGTATGWGKLDYYSTQGSEDLMKVVLTLIESSKCNSSFSADMEEKVLSKGILSSQLCAGELEGGKDTCHGDSGGPLQIVRDEPYCTYSIIGITSFGKFCGFKNSPAVYTRVSYYVPWIESIVWGTN